jgi:hypothetical protein
LQRLSTLGWKLSVIDFWHLIRQFFIKGRFILESVVLAHEIIHEVVKSKDKEIVLKLYYEKAYDRVRPSWMRCWSPEVLVEDGEPGF